ncbi:MAG: hypothetical protein QXW48_01475 [Thermoplasmata archaeon]
MKGTLYKIEEFIIPDINSVEYPEEFEGVEIGMRTKFEEVIKIATKELVPYLYPVFFYDEYVNEGGIRKNKKMPVLGYRFLLLFKENGINEVFGIRLKKENAIEKASEILERIMVNNIYEYEDVIKFKDNYKEIKEEKNEKETEEKVYKVITNEVDRYIEEFKENYIRWFNEILERNIKIIKDRMIINKGMMNINYEMMLRIIKKIKEEFEIKIGLN